MARQKDIVCKVHGPAPVALACRHLASSVACGFHTDVGDPHPDAWCDLCDEMLASAGEWTLEMSRQADMATTCAYCYDLAKQRNRDLPAHARGKRAALTHEEYRKLADYAIARIAGIQEAARTKWEFDAYERWDFDEDTRTLSFNDPDRPTLAAEVHIVGAFAPATNTFAWSWSTHPQGGLLVAGVDGLRTFGEVRGVSQLATSDWRATVADGWEVAAVAGYLLGCEGIYRAEFDDQLWFMLLANWRHPRRGRTLGGFGAQ